jgi:Ser/Thr protein kinase RdoA (MazF antagonist)
VPDSSIEIADALGAWGIDLFTMDRLGGGAANEHWRIGTPGGEPRVLRRYRARQPVESIPYEHDLLRFLAGRDWPVAAPIPATDGRTLVDTDHGRWSLFPFLEGGPSPRETIFQQRKGAVLALLHADMTAWDAPRQRPAWGRVTDLDVQVRADGFASFDALLHWYADLDLERATALAGFRERNLAALERLGYAAQPDIVTYNECLANNVLFEQNDVTGLLDFDFAHADARVADMARSLLFDCWPDGYFLHYWMAGYTAHADPRLRPEEVDLLPALMVANEIWTTAVGLSISAQEPADWLWGSIRRSIDHRLLSLEATEDELRRAVRAGAGMRTR